MPTTSARALAALREVWPNEFVTASHEVLSEIREFERSSTAAINAYLQPVVASYIGKLESALAAQKFPGQLHIVQSNGGIMSTATARKLPVRTALSGPAAGVVAGAAIAKASGFDNLITCDLGGTSFDVSVIAGGKVSVAAQTTIDFGLVIRTPMIEITTIGAGGGSIASVDRGGLLQVGPESAGSVPGPVCYGQGNTRPTLTDAQVVLGRINAARPLGGELKSLDVEAAKRAIAAHVGTPLGLDATAAAAAIVQVADARMAGAIRLVSIERGHDPARFVAMPFGGGGALHVSALIRQIGLKCALVPRFPGITSALGCVLADLRHDMVQTLNVMLERPRRRGARTADARRRPGGQRRHRRLRHRGRADRRAVRARHALSRADPHRCRAVARVAKADSLGVSESMVRSAFEAAYLASFSRLLPGIAMRIVSLRVAAIGRRPAFDFSVFAPEPSASLEKARLGSRPVWFDGGWRDTARVGAARTSRRCKDRRAGHPGAAGRDHRDRAGARRPDRPARQSDRGARLMQVAARARSFSAICRTISCIATAPMAAPDRRSPAIAALPDRLAPLVRAARERGMLIVATLFTLVPGRGGEPIISPHLKALRPFLKKGDFAPGAWGQQLVDYACAGRCRRREDRLFGVPHARAWNGCCANAAWSTSISPAS